MTARRCHLPLLPLLLSLLVAACSAPSPTPETSPEPAPPIQQAPPPAESPPAEITLPPALPDSGLLLGLEPRQMQDVLGAPGLVRREGAAQVMQFRDGDCVLDVTFYEESPGGAFRAEHLSSRKTDGAPITPQQCLAVILPDGRYPTGLFPEQDLPPELKEKIRPVATPPNQGPDPRR